ncbi:hypothetical protein M8C21_017433 [Ambrosia artemisiifolia]|uniref:Autophagy-related protein 13 N-terminal domain-containing protein n=1 Tax=Ambrosia artemisiifolia TaxID=4212 RepID=A0AAD5BTU3_AMBAR|nr:hypothetical protein M8C21_017433 [Ambrosia artemisiifolia]
MAVNPHTEPAKMEQIITEFFAKSLHIILESRCPFVSSHNYSGEQLHSPSSSASASSSSSSIRPRNKWFNLPLRDCPAALENIDFWRQSNLEPMVVDVILVQRPVEFGCDGNSEKVIERWIVRYESRKGCKEGALGNKRSNTVTSHTLYKKSILLLRSLYVTVRLLPCYKIFREINSSGQIRSFSLVHRVSSSMEALTRRDEGEMQQFVFTPVDTSCGKLCISLLYLPSVYDAASESSTPMSPQFITDYVGSPLADPLKRLPSASLPQYSPSSPFGRRHSWSYDTRMASSPSTLPSPSPTYSESRTLYSRYGSHRPPISPRYISLEPAHVHAKDIGYDEYLPSPNYSQSPSPSPPVGSNMLTALLRSDSAPVYIPASRLGDAPLSSNKTVLPFSPPLNVTRPSLSLVERSLSIPTTSAKVLSLREEETARPSGVKISSNSSLHKSSFRSFRRLSFEDSYDDSEFSGPFVVDDDDDTIDPGSRPGSSDRSGNLGTQHERVKSQDAAVGALVQMLKKAPPLQKDLNRSQYVSKTSRPEKSSNQIQDHPAHASSNMSSFSRMSGIRTTSDALEELKGYVDVKQVLLKQSSKP